MSASWPCYKCDACDFERSYSVRLGVFQYELTDGERLNIERCLAWCDCCGTIEAAEEFRVEHLTQLAADAGAKASKLRAELAALLARRNWWQRMMNAETLDQWEIERELKGLEESKARYEKSAEFARQQDRRPLCLTCGSKDIRYLPEVDIEHDSPPISTDFQHPGCGGTLWTHPSNIRYSYAVEMLVYDLQGRFLRSDGSLNG